MIIDPFTASRGGGLPKPPLKIEYTYTGPADMDGSACRPPTGHDWPEGGKRGREKPGTYVCARCELTKTVTRR